MTQCDRVTMIIYMTSRWPEEERGRGEEENPDLLDRITLDGSIVGLDGFSFDGSRVSLDGYKVSSDGYKVGLDGARASLDEPRGIQTDPDRWLEVIWMMSGEMFLVLIIRLLEYAIQQQRAIFG